MKAQIQKHVKRLKSMPKWQRITVGSLLVIGGILGALPVLGFWMIPLGLAILAVDFVWAKRAQRRLRRWMAGVRERWRTFRKP